MVFTTKSRSSTLAREIAADATIAVSLLRQVTVLSRPSPLYSPTALSGTSSSEESDEPPTTARRKLLRRVVRSSPSLSFDSRSSAKAPPKNKPLPPIPHGISDTRSLQTDVCIGFPKRPKNRMASHQRHPSLEETASLPDGLYKGKLRLEKSMLPSIDWAGLGVKASRSINQYMCVGIHLSVDSILSRCLLYSGRMSCGPEYQFVFSELRSHPASSGCRETLTRATDSRYQPCKIIPCVYPSLRGLCTIVTRREYNVLFRARYSSSYARTVRGPQGLDDAINGSTSAGTVARVYERIC